MLNTKQKKHLKSLAQTINPIIIVGKEGVSDNLIKTTKDALNAHELVKVKILDNCTDEKNQVAFDLSAGSNSDIVQIIGRTIILFKQSDKKKIELPK